MTISEGARCPVHGPTFESERMRMLLREVAAFAGCDQPVLIQGDTGVGKELTARLLHDGHPARRHAPFVAINCGAVPESLFESLFFGHARGAFTGALHPHAGYFEQANGGTLFLDEIGELPLLQQVKLLRTLEDGAVTRLGAETPIKTNVRFIAATNRHLRDLVSQQAFRADLYYRIAVIELYVPNLDERGITERMALFQALLGPTPEPMPDWLASYIVHAELPGNIRQLRNIAERVRVVLNQIGGWDREMLMSVLANSHAPMSPGNGAGRIYHAAAQPEKTEHERQALLVALGANDWRRQDTADQLGVSRKTLWQKMRRHGL